MNVSVTSCSNEQRCSFDVSQAETCPSPPKLNEEQKEIIRKQVPASDFKRIKLQEELQKNWDKFYLRNKSNFFKDRRWTQYEFDELLKQHLDLQVSQYNSYFCPYLPKIITIDVYTHRVRLMVN